ncbi:MAG TPA: class I SAM-dependent methyltransferase [Thermoanaerobaculia bacterium]|nr:class I SAM-dependent methyltransferase [Thermoanaerobaculia bacterium]
MIKNRFPAMLSLIALLLSTGCAFDSRTASAAEALPFFTDQNMGPAPVQLDVPYVPTAQATVDEMLRMLRISNDDILYDLGSGDGRIVITAARDHGARGVGYDLDPERISEANANARQAGVTERVKFIQGDLFDADLSEASAVTLYLLPTVNLRLRPKLLAELRPGTPVVSHDFDMGDWAPEETKEVGGDRLFLWIIPARVEGTWRWSGPGGVAHLANLSQEFQKVHGSASIGGTSVALRNGRVAEDEISFELVRNASDKRVTDRYKGRVKGTTIEGTIESSDGTRARWQAVRE